MILATSFYKKRRLLAAGWESAGQYESRRVLKVSDFVSAEITQSVVAGVFVEVVQSGVVKYCGDHRIDDHFRLDDG